MAWNLCSPKILQNLFICLCYCSTFSYSFIIHRTSSSSSNHIYSNNLRHRRSITSLTNPIFLQDWPTLDSVKVKSDEIVIGCFQELSKNFLNRRITLKADKFSRKMGCPLRVPTHTNFRIVKTHVDDEISFSQIFSGPDRSDLQQTSGILRGADGFTFGPFEDEYVLFLFKPTVASDFITFDIFDSSIQY